MGVGWMKKVLFIVIGLVVLLGACGTDDNKNNKNENDSVETDQSANVDENENDESNENEEVENNELEVDAGKVDFDNVNNEENDETIELTEQEEMFQSLLDLIDEGLAFDTGSYVKGDIPKGEYAFVTFDGSGNYYSEEDASGSIIDNENFDSFGYVEVHQAGNIEADGALINIDALEELEVSGAKELYEILNDTEEYFDSGWYKVGADIESGEYIIKSYGSGYVASMSGPVGNNSINENENFEGEYSINLNEGDYLVISKATITDQ